MFRTDIHTDTAIVYAYTALIRTASRGKIFCEITWIFECQYCHVIVFYMNAVNANFPFCFAVNHCPKIQLGHTSRYFIGVVGTRRHLDLFDDRKQLRRNGYVIINRLT